MSPSASATTWSTSVVTTTIFVRHGTRATNFNPCFHAHSASTRRAQFSLGCSLLLSVHEMVMLSTSVLSIKWTIKGKPKSLLASIGGDLIVKVTSQFTLNQISGQVIEHEEFWDFSASSAIAQAYFWTSRRLFAMIEAGKDVADFVKNITSRSSA
ncbi:hypothetical protein CEY00_Acc20827 [Actinidia chinensis var. chinensis]|uniref:Uncharacterized protein n=1 Tax=Actinidia chinensis var. chinensis TaxID=1590841 RepID=A0A2R6QAQ1_ACTCC|nr:hypothetical protein CEY00_Acc20827 [Actinidia chinensis var. chinensis]